MLTSVLNRKQFGFSLVELMVVIALFGILATFAIPSYQAWIQNSMTRTAAESIQTGIQIARAEAVKRNASVQFELRGSDSAWTVCVRPTPAGACPNPDNATTVQSRGVKEGSSANVDITFSAAGPYVFSPFGVIISPAGPITIDVKNGSLSTADSRDLRVVIGVGGSVRMCDPKVTYTTDPRKC
jgi:type IV fimbrial biogenesis protein FimT